MRRPFFGSSFGRVDLGDYPCSSFIDFPRSGQGAGSPPLCRLSNFEPACKFQRLSFLKKRAFDRFLAFAINVHAFRARRQAWAGRRARQSSDAFAPRGPQSYLRWFGLPESEFGRAGWGHGAWGRVSTWTSEGRLCQAFSGRDGCDAAHGSPWAVLLDGSHAGKGHTFKD